MAKSEQRLFERVKLTKRALEMFPGEPLGVLVRLARDGRWLVTRDGNKSPQYWARGFWRRVKTRPNPSGEASGSESHESGNDRS